MNESRMSFDARVNGVRLRGHEWHGNGGPIVLLHGTGFMGMLWAPIATRLATLTGPIYAFDLRGHGESEKAPCGYEWDTLARDIELALDKLGHKRLCLVGHSLGGSLALLLSARRPEMIERCVLIDPVVRKPELLDHDPLEPGVPTADLALVRRASWPNASAARRFLAAKQPYASWNAEILDLFVHHGIKVMADGTARLSCPPLIEAEIYRQRASFDPWTCLPKIHCPSLFIYGTDPRPAVLATPPQVTRAVSGCQLQYLRGGHFVPCEDPVGVFEAIQAFLNS